MELNDAARLDMELAAAVRKAAEALNLAMTDAVSAGLLIAIDVSQPAVDGDTPAEPPTIEVTVERA